MGRSPKAAVELAIVLSWAILGACAHPKVDDISSNPYYTFCGSSGLGLDIAGFLATHGIDCLGAGGDLGGTDWVVRGTPDERFRARELVLAQVRTAGWRVSWPADFIVLMDEWDELGWEKGPWVRLASVHHQKTATEALLERLHGSEIPAYFLFGETSDVIFVKAKDSASAIALLRESPDVGLTIHATKLCIHHPPPLIRRGAPTVLTLTLAGSDTDQPLRERVDDLTCWHQVPGEEITGGYSMQSKNLPDGTLVASYEVPTMPHETTGFFKYSFSFKLDGREYWHRPTAGRFRVPQE